MARIFWAIIKTARPIQWIKNLAVFAALVFTGGLFDEVLLQKTILGFFLLSILVSAIYFINDVADAPQDRLHPFKKERPVARGILPPSTALFVAVLGATISLFGAVQLGSFFFLSLLAYLLLQLAYTFWLKEFAVVDILAIAAGFILRIYAGAFLIDAHLSVWFLLGVISVSLFLAAGKRRAELAVIAQKAGGRGQALSFYQPQLLDSYLSMFATASWVSWALFTFFTEQERAFYLSQAIPPHLLADLPLAISGSGKLLMLTIPVVIFGVMRYLRIVYEGSRAEAPEKVLVSDKPLLGAVAVWALIILVVIYGLEPS